MPVKVNKAALEKVGDGFERLCAKCDSPFPELLTNADGKIVFVSKSARHIKLRSSSEMTVLTAPEYRAALSGVFENPERPTTVRLVSEFPVYALVSHMENGIFHVFLIKYEKRIVRSVGESLERSAKLLELAERFCSLNSSGASKEIRELLFRRTSRLMTLLKMAGETHDFSSLPALDIGRLSLLLSDFAACSVGKSGLEISCDCRKQYFARVSADAFAKLFAAILGHFVLQTGDFRISISAESCEGYFNLSFSTVMPQGNSPDAFSDYLCRLSYSFGWAAKAEYFTGSGTYSFVLGIPAVPTKDITVRTAEAEENLYDFSEAAPVISLLLPDSEEF